MSQPSSAEPLATAGRVPYLRLTCPPLEAQQRQAIATRLTGAINDLLFDPRGRLLSDSKKRSGWCARTACLLLAPERRGEWSRG